MRELTITSKPILIIAMGCLLGLACNKQSQVTEYSAAINTECVSDGEPCGGGAACCNDNCNEVEGWGWTCAGEENEDGCPMGTQECGEDSGTWCCDAEGACGEEDGDCSTSCEDNGQVSCGDADACCPEGLGCVYYYNQQSGQLEYGCGNEQGECEEDETECGDNCCTLEETCDTISNTCVPYENEICHYDSDGDGVYDSQFSCGPESYCCDDGCCPHRT